VVDPIQDGLIVDQIPGAGNTAIPGDIVTVTLGEYIPPPTTIPPTIPPSTTIPPPTTIP